VELAVKYQFEYDICDRTTQRVRLVMYTYNA
jgi:hypothetical protein